MISAWTCLPVEIEDEANTYEIYVEGDTDSACLINDIINGQQFYCGNGNFICDIGTKLFNKRYILMPMKKLFILGDVICLLFGPKDG